MKEREMERLTAHFNRYFEQGDPIVLHPLYMNPHIDVLKYPPTEKYPFWKLATMGASDYRMKGKNPLGNRNEYMMFVDKEEDLDDKETLLWYRSKLLMAAVYPLVMETMVTYGHSMEWPPEEGEEMIGAFLEFPQVIEDSGILRCRLGLVKTAICLQVTLLTRSEIDTLLETGPMAFSQYLYPEEGGPRHFLSQRRRDGRF